jgi:hypothetical protein
MRLYCAAMRLASIAALAALALLTAPVARAQPPLPPHLSVAQADEPPPHEVAAPPPVVQKPVAPEEAPVYKKWWFWALTAAVVGGTVALGVVLAKPAATHPPAPCQSGVLACFGDGR